MNSSLVGVGCIFASLFVSGVRAAPGADTIREDYSEGLRLIGNARESVGRASSVLETVESESDREQRRVRDLQVRLGELRAEFESLRGKSQSTLAEGESLLGRKASILRRLEVSAAALHDMRGLLTGATQAVADLVAATDSSARRGERERAEMAEEALKSLSSDLQRIANEQGQVAVALKLEETLLLGLLSKAKEDVSAVTDGLDECRDLGEKLSGVQALAKRNTDFLLGNRKQLTEVSKRFDESVEQFRLAQVAILNRWLREGPPNGEVPRLTIDDVLDASQPPNPVRPDPSSTVLGQGLLGSDGAVSHGSVGLAGGRAMSDESELNDASEQVVRAWKRVRWYLTILERLKAFSNEVLGDSVEWRMSAEAWRQTLSFQNGQLTGSRGQLTSMRLDMGILTTTIELIAQQMATVANEVNQASEVLSQKAKDLNAVLKRLAPAIDSPTAK